MRPWVGAFLDGGQLRPLTAAHGDSTARRKFSVVTAGDGLPVIRANGGIITSQLVHEIESLTP